MPRVNVDVRRVAAMLFLQGYIYITVDELARILGTSTRAAGRLLAEMQRQGYATRWSKRAYKLLVPAELAV